MRYFITYLLLTLLTFGALVQQAEAGRFGGGRSFGVQRSHSSLFSSRSAYNAKPFTAPRKSATRQWGGLLGGLVAGGLLASLFMGHGFGSGLLSWLMLGLVVTMVFGLLRKKLQPAFQTSQSFQSAAPSSMPFHASAQASSYNGTSSAFDAENFLMMAKKTFIRLQAANFQQNQHDLSEFTSPEVFAEIQMQWQEQDAPAYRVEVKTINAELLDVSKQAYGTLASVHFTGTLSENGVVDTLDEIWHFRQSAPQQPWLLAGIQQEVFEPV